ncbi:hypothetical protein FHR85_001980 [Alkalibacillus almallahensis]|nr:hypothetical protein [Alkalibacillus almallahensis]
MWEHLEDFGCEFLGIGNENNGIITTGIIITSEQHKPYKINYTVRLDQSWKTKKLILNVDNKENLEIISDGFGNWYTGDGKKINELSGAIDIDISATPFSNTLPINRFEWETNQKRDFEMVYISVSSLETFKVKQSYTYLQRNGNIREFLYQSYGFESIIYVDDNGFVTFYPELFERRFNLET